MSRIASRDPSIHGLTARLSRSDLLWVANTAHGPGGHWHARVRGDEPDHDHLASPEAARLYLADHRVPVPDGLPGAAALHELAVVRAIVQRLTRPVVDPWSDEGRRLLASASFRLDPDGRLSAADPGWHGLCRDLLLPLVALVDEGTPLGRCSNPACRLVFQDASRNHARRWCDTGGCGNRDRVRRARRKSSVTTAAPGRPVAPAPAGSSRGSTRRQGVQANAIDRDR